MTDRETVWEQVGRRDKDTAWTTPEGQAALSVKCIVCGAPVDRKCLNPARRELGPRKIWCLGRTSPSRIPRAENSVAVQPRKDQQ